MWLSINSFRGFPTLGKCYFTWPLRLFIVAAVYWCVTLPPARSHCPGWPFSQDTHGGPLWAPVFLSNVYIWFFLSCALSESRSLDVGPLGLGLPSHHTHIHLSGYWICILFFFHSLRKSFTFNLLNRSRQFLKVHLYVISFFFLRLRIGAGESAQWSGVLTAPEEGLSSVSNTCAGCWQVPLWALCSQMFMYV